ncbi:MAG: esterase/lipase family protein [Thermodesulfobacteriota bacterium]
MTPGTTGKRIRECVVLLHGLARSRRSMAGMERAVTADGYAACNIGYPSTRHPLDELAERFVLPEIHSRIGRGVGPIHFVTHSMGGILVRVLTERQPGFPIGRVVMLSPPNKGSEIVDRLGGLRLFAALYGPAGRQLGTGRESVPNRLGPAKFELGVITGDRALDPLLSLLVPGPNDGRVSVESAKLAGMRDFRVLHAPHPFIMRNREALRQTLHFLRHGLFS